MNDKYTNKIIIKYKYYQYCHDWFYEDKYKELDILHPKFNYDIYHIIQQLYSNTKSNINVYINYIVKNKFLSIKTRKIQEIVYLDIQKIKRTLHFFVKCCKYKMYRKFNLVNLYYEPLKKNAIFLMEDKIKYGFDNFEIKKIVSNSFNYMEMDYPTIINIKNPYTNKSFSLTNIYNIYFYLFHNLSLPLMFHSYFKNNLNKYISSIFYITNHYIECYKNKYNNCNNNFKVFVIKKMFSVNRYFNFKHLPENIIIDYFLRI